MEMVLSVSVDRTGHPTSSSLQGSLRSSSPKGHNEVDLTLTP